MTTEKRRAAVALMVFGLIGCLWPGTRPIGALFAGLGAGMLSRED